MRVSTRVVYIYLLCTLLCVLSVLCSLRLCARRLYTYHILLCVCMYVPLSGFISWLSIYYIGVGVVVKRGAGGVDLRRRKEDA